MAQNNMHNLVTLIKRLEAATTRLEDIASSTIELPQAVPALTATVATPSSLASPIPHAALPPPPALKEVPEEHLPESIEEFDNFISQSVEKYVAISNKLGGFIAEQASKVLGGFKQQRRFLLISTRAKKPDITGPDMVIYQELLTPINQALMDVGSIRDSSRGSPFFTHLSAVAEGIMVLAWVTVDNRPFKHVEESLASAQFFGNRVLKEQKDKDPIQTEWIQSFYQVFKDLVEYVKLYFPNGIPWNAKGQPASEVAKSLTPTPSAAAAAPPPPPAAGGPPPPPPPPGPPPVFQIKEQAAPSKPDGMGAVFSELNKGESVTKGLRKVDRSEMTHKNPALRAGSTVSDSSRGKSPAPGKKPKPESMRLKKPPKKELDGNKWIIENFDKHPDPIEIEAEMSHSILISRCNQTTVIIKGKANAVTIENTQRLSIVVDSLVSTVDVVKSSNFALQVLGTLPTVLLDQLDGAQVYLSKESSSTRIFSSKSAGINVNIIAGDDEDYKEIPLPGQICSYFDEAKGDMVNEIVDHAG
ncbi:adenylate cyclase associated N terminal-domain-containing protein [Annulohypoxylon maeteangense]|uniref:adenylate cyclase associated N terminal-domain-containing protein n=1 Tax=Annulohypoxylon maeteangense TaxID=1927788 RepID=UPI0020072D61|nr:adenylate cyclase associated N terminal-domain-containing protein [Annulohypoxylon maeteangense]KAI0890204.1 adenylate cyclase associated N terminal-domain-containing protein [Annulohypoxylon maeteangense]